MNSYVRKAVLSDIDQIYQFERAYMVEHEPNRLKLWEKRSDSTKNQLNNCLPFICIAEVDGNIVGHGYWSLYEEKPSVYSIFVLKSYRGQGIGKTLMTAIEASVVESGFDLITLSTLESNPAQHLFDQMGYQRLNVIDRWIRYEKILEK